MNANQLDQAAKMLKALAHPQRMAIVDLLGRIYPERMTVTAIYTALDMRQAIASQHLISLKERGVLTSKKEGTSIYYSLVLPELLEVVRCIESNLEDLVD